MKNNKNQLKKCYLKILYFNKKHTLVVKYVLLLFYFGIVLKK